MMVEIFVQSLKTLACYIEALPHADPNSSILTNTQMKNIIFKMMPTQWQVQLICAHSGPALVTLLELHNFMANAKSFADGLPANGPTTASVVITNINLVKNFLLFIMILPSSNLTSLDRSLLKMSILMAL
jgi:hypothetical protein